jgi:hypothetical protein
MIARRDEYDGESDATSGMTLSGIAASGMAANGMVASMSKIR